GVCRLDVFSISSSVRLHRMRLSDGPSGRSWPAPVSRRRNRNNSPSRILGMCGFSSRRCPHHSGGNGPFVRSFLPDLCQKNATQDELSRTLPTTRRPILTTASPAPRGPFHCKPYLRACQFSLDRRRPARYFRLALVLQVLSADAMRRRP